jgi:DNA-binding Lrp family transcriptional regulator
VLHGVGASYPLVDVSSSIDDLDARLIAEMRKQPRIPVVELARRLGVARGTAQARLARLEDRGVIAGHGPEVEPAGLGYAILAFVQLDIAQGRLADAVEHLRKIPEVLEAHGTSGPHDLLCRVVARDTEHLQEVLNGVLGTAAIRRSTSSISLSRPIRLRTGPLVEEAGQSNA